MQMLSWYSLARQSILFDARCHLFVILGPFSLLIGPDNLEGIVRMRFFSNAFPAFRYPMVKRLVCFDSLWMREAQCIILGPAITVLVLDELIGKVFLVFLVVPCSNGSLECTPPSSKLLYISNEMQEVCPCSRNDRQRLQCILSDFDVIGVILHTAFFLLS